MKKEGERAVMVREDVAKEEQGAREEHEG